MLIHTRMHLFNTYLLSTTVCQALCWALVIVIQLVAVVGTADLALPLWRLYASGQNIQGVRKL